MKKLVGFFLWFCAASVLAQICIVGLAAVNGNFSRRTLSQVIALMNGIDIQAKRLETALITARDTPVPSYEDVLNAKTNAELQLNSRTRALDRLQRQLGDQQRELQKKIEDFDERRIQFELKLEQLRTGSQNNSLKEIQNILENMAPEAAKKQLALMLLKNELSDVVSIILGFPPDKQKKVLAEFTETADDEMLAKVFAEIRRAGPNNPIDEASKPQKP
jgi:hypothetical protein